MKRLVLFPSKETHIKAAAIGAVNGVIGTALLGILPRGAAAVPMLVAVAGLLMIAAAAWRYYNPAPCFEADADGFTILGGKTREWSQFRGAAVRHSTAAFSAAPSSVVIMTGKSVLGRQIPIKYTHLSAPVTDMVAEIEAYAKHAQRKICLTEALAHMPVQDITVPSAVVPQTNPTLSERIFGRREVI